MQQHKEFAGHTHTSLRHIYSNISVCARKKLNLDIVTPQQVAAYVAETYKPMERKGSNSMEEQRENFITAFEEKIGEAGINIKIYILCCFRAINNCLVPPGSSVRGVQYTGKAWEDAVCI